MARVVALLMICTLIGMSPQAVAEEKPKVLFLDLKPALVKPEEAQILTEMISAELGQYTQYEVISSTDLRQMAALEAEKQSAGCSDSSCLAELAGAMGARYVIFGNLGKLGDQFILTLNLFDSVAAKAVSRNVVKAKDLGAISDGVSKALKELLTGKKLRNDMGTSNTDEVRRPLPWGAILGGGTATIIGAALAAGWGLPAFTLSTTEQANYDAAVAEENLTEEQHNATKAANDAFNSGPVFGLYGGAVLAVSGLSVMAWALGTHLAEE